MAQPFAKMFVELCGANTTKLCISSHRILHLVLSHVHPAPARRTQTKTQNGEKGAGWGGGRLRSLVLHIWPEEAGDLCAKRHLGVGFPRGGHDPTRGRGSREKVERETEATDLMIHTALEHRPCSPKVSLRNPPGRTACITDTFMWTRMTKPHSGLVAVRVTTVTQSATLCHISSKHLPSVLTLTPSTPHPHPTQVSSQIQPASPTDGDRQRKPDSVWWQLG